MKVRPVAVGKRSYTSKDGTMHTSYAMIVTDGDRLIGFEQRDGIAPVVGVDVDVDITSSFEVRKPWQA